MSGWRCQMQGGYCALINTFQYRNNMLFYTSREGEMKQYVSNCNVLCKKCRFRRCQEMMNDTETSAAAGGCCVVCRSNQDLVELGICSKCFEFMTDSVTESSHSAMTCTKTGEILIIKYFTPNFKYFSFFQIFFNYS